MQLNLRDSEEEEYLPQRRGLKYAQKTLVDWKDTLWKNQSLKAVAGRGRRGLKYARRKILVHTNKEDSGRAPDPRRVWIVGIHTSPIQSFQSVCEILTFLNYFFDPCSRGRVCWKKELQKKEKFLLQSFFLTVCVIFPWTHYTTRWSNQSAGRINGLVNECRNVVVL